MPFIGKQPAVGNFVKLDAITTSATATYNLLNGGVAYFPQTANNCIVSLNGVIQSPTSAYTISGSTIVFSDALTSSDSIDFILVLGDVLSIGTPSDGTITSAKLASGLSGLISWQSVQTTGFTASAGRGYPCNTTSSAFTVTLPASPSVGDTIILLDYAGTFATNNITITSTLKINGSDNDVKLTTNREATTLVYVDSTQGWVATSGVNEGTSPSLTDFPATYSVDFLVIAGGGGGAGAGGGGSGGGGGGAGGYRNSFSTETSGGGGSSESSLTFSLGTVYTITVGAGGSGGTSAATGAGTNGSNGSNSSISGTGISTITSTGGGGGGSESLTANSGGSGGGKGRLAGTEGAGTANQGYRGGNTAVDDGGTGGGGAGAVGENAPSGASGGNGGAGLASSITGSSVTRGGGGGGGARVGNGGTNGSGGSGGGATAGTAPSNATANTGGGGAPKVDGSNNQTAGLVASNGGKGVVIIRMPTANYSGTTTGSPTVTTDGSDKVIVFNDSGTITG